jgi:hypothetical protein
VHRHAANKTLVLRDLPKSERVQWHLDNYRCLSPDGRWLLLPSQQGRLRRWDVTTGQESSPLTEAPRTVWGLISSSEGRFMAVHGSPTAPNVRVDDERGGGRALCVWDMTTGTRLRHLTLPDRGGMCVIFSHDGRTMLTTDLQGVIHLHEMATGKERGRWRGHFSHEIGALALSADGRMLVSGGYDSQALVWDLTVHRGRRLCSQAFIPSCAS